MSAPTRLAEQKPAVVELETLRRLIREEMSKLIPLVRGELADALAGWGGGRTEDRAPSLELSGDGGEPDCGVASGARAPPLPDEETESESQAEAGSGRARVPPLPDEKVELESQAEAGSGGARAPPPPDEEVEPESQGRGGLRQGAGAPATGRGGRRAESRRSRRQGAAIEASQVTTDSALAWSSSEALPVTPIGSAIRLSHAVYNGFGTAKLPERSDFVSRIADRWEYVTFNALAIFANCLIIGVQSNVEINQARSEGEVQPVVFFQTSELVFLSIFAVELGVNVWRRGLRFFYGEHVGSHWLDVIIVTHGMLSVSQTLVPGGTVAKALRVFGIAKVLRIIRGMAMVRSFRAILKSLQSSFPTLLCAVGMISLTIYTFAVVFVMGVTRFLEESHGDDNSELLDNFGSVQVAMWSLFVSLTDSWGVPFAALRPVGLLYSSIFVGFLLFAQLALTNVILGLFVDAAMSAIRSEPDEVAEEEARGEQRAVQDIEGLLLQAGVGEEGTISKEDWEDHVWKGGHGPVLSYLQSTGLRRRDAQKYFEKCLRKSEGRPVNIDMFLQGCMKLRGTASRFDIKKLRWDMQQLLEQVGHFRSEFAGRPLQK